MADHTITISNALQCLGVGDSSLWGDMVWGVDNWGSTEDLRLGPGKVTSETLTLTDSISASAQFNLSVLNNLLALSETVTMELTTGNGWNYNFVGDEADADNRNLATWSKDSDPSTSYTKDEDPTTAWSAA